MTIVGKEDGSTTAWGFAAAPAMMHHRTRFYANASASENEKLRGSGIRLLGPTSHAPIGLAPRSDLRQPGTRLCVFLSLQQEKLQNDDAAKLGTPARSRADEKHRPLRLFNKDTRVEIQVRSRNPY